MIAQQHDDGDEQRHPERGPDELRGRVPLAGCRQVETVEQHEPDAVEQDRDREQQGVRVRGAEADREVRDEGEQTQPRAVGEGVGRGGVVAGEADGDVTEDGDQDGAHEERELDPAPLAEA